MGPNHQSIVIVDVEGSGRRTDPEKIALRQSLYRLLMVSFARAGILWDQCVWEDRGDGVYLLIPSTVPKPVLVTTLVEEINRLVGEWDPHDTARYPLRLRIGLHAGEVTMDEHGSSGVDVDLAFALVDADKLKATLRAAPHGHLAIAVSGPFYQATVRQGYPGADPTTFSCVDIATKNGIQHAWLRVPGYPHPPGLPATSHEAERLS